MKKEIIVYVIVSLLIGAILGLIITNKSTSLSENQAQRIFQEAINKEKDYTKIVESQRDCLSQVSKDMSNEIMFCLQTSGVCHNDGLNLEACRDCFWKIYNSSDERKNKCYAIVA